MALLPRREFAQGELVIQFETTIPADATSITPVVDQVMQAVAEAGCADGAEDHIELALREALANAIRHGCRNDPTKTVQCQVACDAEHDMVIIVRDSGEGFDPAQVPSPLVGENLYSHHGRGIFLINQLMDEVRFNRNGTEIRMRKRLRRTSADPET